MTHQGPSATESVLALSTLKALRQHLESVEAKKTAFAVVTKRKDLEAHLQPGDILVTTNAPAHATGTFGAALNNTLRAGIRAMYGDAGHAAAYVGDGKTVEMAAKLHHYALAHSLRGKDVTVLRPKGLTDEQRAAAVELLKKTVATEQAVSQYASPGTLARSLVEDFTGKKTFKDTEKELTEQKRYTCSNLVAHAYKQTADLDVRDHKSLGSVSPMDFLESSKMERVVTFHNPNRHDKHLRQDPAKGGVLAALRRKVAAEPVPIKVKRDAAKVLRPGDILVVSSGKIKEDPMRNPLGWASEAVFDRVSKKLYGGNNAHVAIYVGKNRAVEMQSKLQNVDISKVFSNRDVRIVRPATTAKIRAQAAERASALQKAVGGSAEYARGPWLLKLLANDNIDRKMFLSDAQKELAQNRFICSNLIAKSYAGDVDFAPGKDHGFVTPKDLSQSPAVKHIGTYLNPKRWDKEHRATG